MATLIVVSEDCSGTKSVSVPGGEASYWASLIKARVTGVGQVVRCGLGLNENGRPPYLGQIVCPDGDFRALMTAREMAREAALI